MTNMERREALRGMSIALIGGVFWGLAGVFGQYLFEHNGTNARWLVSVRLLVAGALLLATVVMKQRDSFWKIWTNRRDAVSLSCFPSRHGGVPAVLLHGGGTVQRRDGDGPAVYSACDHPYIRAVRRGGRRDMSWRPSSSPWGDVHLATHGNPGHGPVPGALVGDFSAVMMAVYNLLPGKLMKKYGTFCVIGWGMLVGGISCPRSQGRGMWRAVGSGGWEPRGRHCRGDRPFILLLHGGRASDRGAQGQSAGVCGAGHGHHRLGAFYARRVRGWMWPVSCILAAVLLLSRPA